MDRTSRNRLNTDQFLALRSIAKNPWQWNVGRSEAVIQWKFHKRWYYIFSRDHNVLIPMDGETTWGNGCYHQHNGWDDIFEKSYKARDELIERGLVQDKFIRCCPGTSCHNNDRHIYRLTERGLALIEKANANYSGQPRASDPVSKICTVHASLLARLPRFRRFLMRLRPL